MTVYCPQIHDSLGFRSWVSTGVSDVATRVGQVFEESLEHYLESRLEVLIPEIENLSNGPTIVDGNTIGAAVQFAYSLPRFGPIPEVSADPDGEISFDWFGRSGEMFSVSVNSRKRLAYAGWFGETSRIHGIEKLAEGCPQQIVRGIQRATR